MELSTTSCTPQDAGAANSRKRRTGRWSTVNAVKPNGFGERAADKLTDVVGSWPFVIGQAVFLGLWFVLNTVAWCFHWDGYPFILANLFMSAEAAFTGPIIMMSQNRSAEADREILHKDFLADSETNKIVEAIADHLGVTRD